MSESVLLGDSYILDLDKGDATYHRRCRVAYQAGVLPRSRIPPSLLITWPVVQLGRVCDAAILKQRGPFEL